MHNPVLDGKTGTSRLKIDQDNAKASNKFINACDCAILSTALSINLKSRQTTRDE